MSVGSVQVRGASLRNEQFSDIDGKVCRVIDVEWSIAFEVGSDECLVYCLHEFDVSCFLCGFFDECGGEDDFRVFE